MSSVHDGRLLELPTLRGQAGHTTSLDGMKEAPFAIKRVFYLYGVPHGASRGGHAHKELQQLIVCVRGAVDVTLDDGREKKRLSLARPSQGMYVPRLIWCELDNFSPGAVCVVLASAEYDEADYYRNYDAFLRAKGV